MFFDREPGLLPLYLALRETILRLVPCCEVRVHRTQVSFRAPRPFAWVWLPLWKNIRGRSEHYLVLTFATAETVDGPLITECVNIRPGLYTCHAVLSSPEQLDAAVTDYLDESYALRNKNRQRKT